MNSQDFKHINAYQKEYLLEVKKMYPTNKLHPWKLKKSLLIEGLIAVGWNKSNEIVLITNDKYLIYNPLIEMFSDEVYVPNIFELFSTNNLKFKIGNRTINIFGLYGGDGNRVSSDGWVLEIIHPYWPNAITLLREPTVPGNLQKKWAGIKLIELKLIDYYDLKCGFSPDFKSFVISNGNGFEIFVRDGL